jgi:dTDP-4-amino-4,6-dideoxygalactose transaminase
MGGDWVQKTEKLLGEKIDNEKTLLVNSCTSALYIACAAIGLQPGDEVIVTPWSMSCSATMPLMFGAVPVFADIEYDSFCLNPDDVAKKITNRTKAIIVVDLFGNIADYERLWQLARKHNIYIIEDAAQAIGASLKYGCDDFKMHAGTLGHIGCFSFTQGKHFTAGEGGAIVCSDETLYARCALIRNHAESVIHDLSIGHKTDNYMLDDVVGTNEIGLVGGNFRMTELQAILLYEQLLKWNEVMQIRKNNVEKLREIERLIPYIDVAKPRPGVEHSYYIMPFYFRLQDEKVNRDLFLSAVRAELTEEEGRIDRGIPIGGGYIKPLYLFPLFADKIHTNRTILLAPYRYKKGLCPACELLYEKEFFLTLYNGLPLTDQDCTDIIEAFYKVYKNIDELRE